MLHPVNGSLSRARVLIGNPLAGTGGQSFVLLLALVHTFSHFLAERNHGKSEHLAAAMVTGQLLH